MHVHIVTEGPTDADLLGHILGDGANQCRFVPAGGTSPAKALARTLLSHRKVPVILVLDSDTLEQQRVRDLREEYRSMLASVSRGTPFLVTLIVPQIEALLFESTSLIEKLAGESLSRDYIAAAKMHPRVALERLLSHSAWARTLTDLLAKLGATEKRELLDAPAVCEMLSFIEEVAHSRAAAA